MPWSWTQRENGSTETPQKRKKGDKAAGKEDEEDEMDNGEMTVPQLTGDAQAIQLLKSSEAVKNLGLFSCLNGYNDVHMLQMRERMEDWTKRVKNGALPIQSVWTSYTH